MPKKPKPGGLISAEPILRNYADSMAGPGKDLEGIHAFDTYIAGRFSAQQLLAAARLPGEDEKAPGFDKRLEDAAKSNPQLQPEIDAFKVGLDDSNYVRDILSTAAATFRQELTNLMNEAKASPPPAGFNTLDIPQRIQAIKENALNAIKEAQLADLRTLQANIFNPSAIPNCKDNLEKTLTTQHQKEIEAFSKACDNMVQATNQHLFAERQRIAILKQLCAINKKYESDIDALAAQALAKTTQVPTTPGDPSNKFYGVKLSMLNQLTTVTGNGINRSGDNLSITIPGGSTWTTFKHWFGSSDDDDRADLTMLAAALMAEGVENITMTVNCDDPTNTDPNKIMEIARKAYEGCILAGYPPEKITIKAPIGGEEKKMEVVSGLVDKNKTIKPSEKLFASDPERLTALHKRGEEARNLLQSGIDASQMKNQINPLINHQQQPAAAPGAAVPAATAGAAVPAATAGAAPGDDSDDEADTASNTSERHPSTGI